MVEEIFSGLLEGLVELVLEVVSEVVGEILSSMAEWRPEGWGRAGESEAVGPVERYKFLPRDTDG